MEVVRNKLNAGLALVLVGVLSMVGTAHAALPAAAATAFTDMETDFEALYALAYPILITIVIAMMVWRYSRKFGNKI